MKKNFEIESMEFTCDYAKACPITLVDRINDECFCELWASWFDIDEDAFRIEVLPLVPNVKEDTIKWVKEYIKSYLFEI